MKLLRQGFESPGMARNGFKLWRATTTHSRDVVGRFACLLRRSYTTPLTRLASPVDAPARVKNFLIRRKYASQTTSSQTNIPPPTTTKSPPSTPPQTTTTPPQASGFVELLKLHPTCLRYGRQISPQGHGPRLLPF
jgi:hypothetical protein